MSLRNTVSDKQLACRRNLLRIRNKANIAMLRFDDREAVNYDDVENIAKELNELLGNLASDGYLIEYVVIHKSHLSS